MQVRQGGDVFRLARQLDVRVAADHPGGRARRVEEDALERLAVPPLPGGPGVGGDQAGLQAEPLEVFPNPYQAALLEVDGDHFGQSRLGFQQVAGLAARRTAGVEDTLAGRAFEQLGGQLRGFVLDADAALREAR